jgi:hypothetical protein
MVRIATDFREMALIWSEARILTSTIFLFSGGGQKRTDVRVLFDKGQAWYINVPYRKPYLLPHQKGLQAADVVVFISPAQRRAYSL